MIKSGLKNKFSAVVFDLDGTLYPNRRFYWRLIPFVFKEFRFLKAFGKVRSRLHQRAVRQEIAAEDEKGLSFYELQSRYMSEILGGKPEIICKKIENSIYRGWEPLFRKVRLYSHVKETLSLFKERGIKLAILSDFPPENKIKNLELSGYWDFIYCSEHCGRLKPDPYAFNKITEVLGIPPDKILYVGNSVDYDVTGAKRAGMKAAWLTSWLKKNLLFLREKEKAADFIFYDYRKLYNFVVS